MKFLQKKNQSGFTIIEVMIVLAIAGVMIAAVLVAVPQLQRNQRNTARRAILGRAKTEIDNYVGNNNGVPPTQNANATTGFTGGFATRYITSNVTSFTDPNGTAVTLAFYAAGATTPAIPAGATPAGILYRVGFICAGEALTGVGNARQYAVAIGLEGGAIYCLDNQ